MGLNYKIQYKKGAENRVADALSRVNHAQPLLNAISVAQPTWLSELQGAYLQDEIASKLLQELSISSPMGHYKVKDGFFITRLESGLVILS